MIIKCDTIAHGLNLINYADGKCNDKRRTDRIDEKQAHRLDSYRFCLDDSAKDMISGMQIYHYGHDRVKRKYIRLEICPEPDQCPTTVEGWSDLGREVMAKLGIFDPDKGIERDFLTIWHAGAISPDGKFKERPHLHIIANRIDTKNNVFKDNRIGIRAKACALDWDRRHGHRTAEDIHKAQQEQAQALPEAKQIARTLRTAFAKDLPKSWKADNLDALQKAVEGAGLRFELAKSPSGKLHGYRVGYNPGQMYKISDISQSFSLSKLPAALPKIRADYQAE